MTNYRERDPPIPGVSRPLSNATDRACRKYGLAYRLATFAEQIAARGRKPRVVCGSQCHTDEFAEFDDLPIGSVAAGSGKSMRFNGTTVLRLENALRTEGMGLDGGVAVPQQAGIAGLPAFGLD